MPETTFRTKFDGGVWVRGAPQIFWVALLVWATIECNDFQVWYTTWVKNWGSGLEEHLKMWDPLLISPAFEANNFKFGIQLGFGE